jgi:hypothetical protein
MDDVSYLSQEIGPRPAGTEEEQQAALYIADKVHERTGFHAEIEDINCMANPDLVDLIYFAFAFVCLLLAFLLPVTSIVTFVLALLCAVLYVVEDMAKKPILVRLLTRDQYGDRFEASAMPYAKIHRALQDQTEEERSFIRQQDERNKLERIRRQLELDELLHEQGMAPDQQGLVDPGLSGLNESKKSFERLLEKAAADRRAEPAPAAVYPASIGLQEKADSLKTQYDPTDALSRI